MNIGVLRETQDSERRVALTPPVVRKLVEGGNTVWVEKGAGERAMFRDDEYIGAGARVAYSQEEVIHRSQLVPKVAVPTPEEAALFQHGTTVMAFYHLAVKSRSLVERLIERSITAIGYEVIESDRGRLPVLAAISEIAGQVSISVAAQLLRSTSGGRGIWLGGSPGLEPGHVVILGAGSLGASAARTASAAGARVTVLDIDEEKLSRVSADLPQATTGLANRESIAAAAASADVLIGAVLVAGRRAPHLVTRQMVESMQRGSVIIDASIDQGGCVETSRPMTLADPPYLYHGVVHYAVPNMTADMSRSASMALARALFPYLLQIAAHGVLAALAASPELRRGVYIHAGACVRRSLAEALGFQWTPEPGPPAQEPQA
jgi:alanine dehydrogenase